MRNKADSKEAIVVSTSLLQVTPETIGNLDSFENCSKAKDPFVGLSKNAKKNAKGKLRWEKAREESLVDSFDGCEEAVEVSTLMFDDAEFDRYLARLKELS